MLIRFRGKGVAAIYTNCNAFGDLLSCYSFRYQCLYSTSSTPGQTHFLVKYLVDSLGFSNQEANSISSKVTSKISKNPESRFSHQFPESRFSHQFLLRPTVDLLRRTLGTKENVVKAIKRSARLLTFGLPHIMEANLLLLRNFGFSNETIRKLVLIYPNYLTQKPERIKDVLHRVENDFLVPRDSPSFIYGFQVLASQKKSTLDRKIGIFKSFGWSDNEILEMFRKLPQCVALSEVRIQEKLNFFMNELGCEPADLASQPSMLIFSLEKRVVPRMQVLKILDEKKLERRVLAHYTVVR